MIDERIHVDRPIYRALWVIALLILAPVAPVLAQSDESEPAAKELITPATDRSIERGLRWLANSQHEDGSFGAGAYRGNVAVTALAGMALMCQGSTPDRGEYGGGISRALAYLLSKCESSGYIIDRPSAGHGPMYGHGFATMFLAECYGMSPRDDLREKLNAAVRLIVQSQNRAGGWRYQPRPVEADISVTVCQMMALRAARNAGLYVPPETVERCVGYVRACQNDDGGFMYMLDNPGDSAFPRSAAALVGLSSAGIYKGEAIDRGIQYVLEFTPTRSAMRRENYFFYGHYYAVQAMWQRGGEPWARWYPAIRDHLLRRQEDDGSWNSTTVDRPYGTSMALIVLQIPNNYLPIFER